MAAQRRPGLCFQLSRDFFVQSNPLRGAGHRRVRLAPGDGGLYYHIAELETAARYGINLVLVVNNNSALNQEIPHIDAAHGGKPTERARELWTFADVNFADIARSFGCLGIRVEDPKDLPSALERALAAERPVVIDAVTDWRALAAKAWTGA